MFRLVLALVFSLTGSALQSAEDGSSPSFLARHTQLVVRGVVSAKTVKRDPGHRIFTAVEVEVSEVWKGKLPQKTITVVHPGGVLAEEFSVSSGHSEYHIDEEVILFLVPANPGQFVTVGLGNGKFTLNPSSKDTAKNLQDAPVRITELKRIVAQ